MPRISIGLPTKVLLAATGAVGASTAVLPSVTGYGTLLFQLVAVGAWGLVAVVTSGNYAETHDPVVWSIAFLLNVLLFLVPAGLIWLKGRTRARAIQHRVGADAPRTGVIHQAVCSGVPHN